MNYNVEPKFNFDFISELNLDVSEINSISQVDFHKTIHAAMFVAVERERTKISSDLHDNFSQELTILKRFIEILTFFNPCEETKKTILEEMNNIVQGVIKEVRDYSFELQPASIFDSDLTCLLQQLFNRLNLAFPNFIESNIKLFSKIRLTQLEKQFVYRVIQEFITNSLKYSKASKISFSLIKLSNQFEFTIKDNGCGFDLSDKGKGAGLINIEKRLMVLGAVFSIESSKGLGTQLTFSINAK